MSTRTWLWALWLAELNLLLSLWDGWLAWLCVYVHYCLGAFSVCISRGGLQAEVEKNSVWETERANLIPAAGHSRTVVSRWNVWSRTWLKAVRVWDTHLVILSSVEQTHTHKGKHFGIKLNKITPLFNEIYIYTHYLLGSNMWGHVSTYNFHFIIRI